MSSWAKLSFDLPVLLLDPMLFPLHSLSPHFPCWNASQIFHEAEFLIRPFSTGCLVLYGTFVIILCMCNLHLYVCVADWNFICMFLFCGWLLPNQCMSRDISDHWDGAWCWPTWFLFDSQPAMHGEQEERDARGHHNGEDAWRKCIFPCILLWWEIAIEDIGWLEANRSSWNHLFYGQSVVTRQINELHFFYNERIALGGC